MSQRNTSFTEAKTQLILQEHFSSSDAVLVEQIEEWAFKTHGARGYAVSNHETGSTIDLVMER